jgi:hypothetical protein
MLDILKNDSLLVGGCGNVQTRAQDPGPKIFFPTRFDFSVKSKYSGAEVKCNTLILLFSTKRKILILEALVDGNEQQEMIVYRFFSPSNQL